MVLGGELGAAVIAVSADTTARFVRTRILGTEGAQIEEPRAVDFTATAVRVR